MYVIGTSINTTTHQLQAGLQHSPQLLLARSRYRPLADLRWPGGWDAHLPPTLELPEAANMCPLSFRCTEGVSTRVTWMLKMDVVGRAGALYTQPPRLDTRAQSAVSSLGKINLSISVHCPEAASPSHRRCHSHHHCHMASVKKDKKSGIFAFLWDVLGSFRTEASVINTDGQSKGPVSTP